MGYKEKDFEEAIEEYLCSDEGGYTRGDPQAFDRERALDTASMISFIKNTQGKMWAKYCKIVGADAEAQFLRRFCQYTARNDVTMLDILRRGIETRGCKFRFVYWKPEMGVNEELLDLYDKNVLSCVRQLHYSPKNENSLDMTLFLNGIPVVTLELKNQFTGQSVKNGMRQYRYDRSPNEPIFQFKKRTLAHFAVDLYEVEMTTRLAGKDTRFMPFNQGSGGAGKVGGKGNPATKGAAFPTEHLWKKVLQKDVLLEIFHKYMLYDKAEDRMIFPRYHQLDVVTKLIKHVRTNGAGHSYLIQHSAGSGKSNSIAWLAHRLSGLHNEKDEKIFRSVIIVTDRRVLDDQLQDTVFQFDHVPGVVEKIDKDSVQLRDALNSGKKIIITTLQKFPVIFEQVESGKHRYAVIIDEAHSSQTGESAKKLKRALLDKEAALEEYARKESAAERNAKDDEDKLIEEMAAHGHQPNLSFFAFTATPKSKTLQMFGTKTASGQYVPFHIYSMRQAIEEGYILDVLKNYLTYKMYYKILKKSPDNPELDSGKAIAAIKRFETLHPHNIAQKTEIIMEHFNRITKHKIGGKAKAMVVTASRLHAVRYLFAIKSYIEQRKMENVDVLVAFSGEVQDGGETYTETKINHTKDGEPVSEKALPEVFRGGDFNVLVVAEKYQTGFDEPLLHTMFVDKKLDGVKAVQTLSRLNRTAPGKEDTFILDFVNDAEDIQEAFQPFYEATILTEGTDPDVVYDMRKTLDDFGVYDKTDVETVSDVYYRASGGKTDMGKLAGLLKPVIDRFLAIPKKEEQENFRTLLARFNRVYAFVTQVARMFDRDMQKYSVFAHFLQKVLPKKDREPVDIEDILNLEYYKLKKNFEGTIGLSKGEIGEVSPIGGGDGSTTKPKKNPLDEIIQSINEKYKTNFTEMDKVLSQFHDDFMADEKAVNFAKENSEKMFYNAYYKNRFEDIAFERFQQNDEFAKFVMGTEGVMETLMMKMLHGIYQDLKRK